MSRRYGFKCGWNRQALKLIRFEQVKWLVWAQIACQFQAIECTTSPFSVQIEKRPPGPTGLHRYERSPRVGLCFPQQRPRQLFYRCTSKEGGEGQLLATDLRHSIKQTPR